MPVYEYYCRHCDGVFELLRPMRLSAEPATCPQCMRESQRIISTEFAAFTYRDGYPRRIPDKGTYWHLGKEVKSPVTGPVRPNEHPEINKPEPPPKPLKGDLEEQRERERIEAERKAFEEKERQARIIEWEWKKEHQPKKLEL